MIVCLGPINKDQVCGLIRVAEANLVQVIKDAQSYLPRRDPSCSSHSIPWASHVSIMKRTRRPSS